MKTIPLLEALKNVDKDRKNEGSVDVEDLKYAIGMAADMDYPEDYWERVKSYHVIKWQCTDTWVGLEAIFFDDELIGYSWQEARKSDTNIEFVSVEAGKKMWDYLSPQFKPEKVSVVKPEEQIADHYTVTYGSQLLVKEGYYKGELVKVIQSFWNYADIDNWRYIIVEKYGKICLDDFYIPLHLKKEEQDGQAAV